MTDRVLDRYDALLLDLDGTVYRGHTAIAGAEEMTLGARQAGVAIRFVTNNASRSPAEVSMQLKQLGISANPEEVVTSAQTAAEILATKLPPGSDVFVLGTESLAAEVSARGLHPVRHAAPEVSAVVQGFSPDIGWRDLAEASFVLSHGALWVACNLDTTLRVERGLAPGNGSLVQALVTATSLRPLAVGKPERPMMDAAVRSTGAAAPLVIGDRLDTDIAGAKAIEADSFLVLSGVSTAADLLAAPADQRPRYVAEGLLGLLCSVSEVEIAPSQNWSVLFEQDTIWIEPTVSNRPVRSLELLRALCAAWWSHSAGPVTVASHDDSTAAALVELGLSVV